MTWQDECRAKGGVVTVMPKAAGTPADQYTYIPACRISNGDGTSKYVDMRSWEETREDNAEIFGDQWDILLGDAVTVRDDVVGAVKNTLTFSAVLAICGVGILLLLRERE